MLKQVSEQLGFVWRHCSVFICFTILQTKFLHMSLLIFCTNNDLISSPYVLTLFCYLYNSAYSFLSLMRLAKSQKVDKNFYIYRIFSRNKLKFYYFKPSSSKLPLAEDGNKMSHNCTTHKGENLEHRVLRDAFINLLPQRLREMPQKEESRL